MRFPWGMYSVTLTYQETFDKINARRTPRYVGANAFKARWILIYHVPRFPKLVVEEEVRV